MANGIFITFEGGEGCGKSSHIKSLAQYFADKKIPCVVSREPGGTPLGERVRDLLLNAKEGGGMSPRTEILLFEAARAEHVERLIKPALAEGKIVLCDRFYDSTTAYQGVARMLDSNDVAALNKFATGGLTPDLTIILDIPAEAGLARAKIRDNGSADRMGSEKVAFYDAVRSAFLNLAKAEPNRFVVVDSSADKTQTFAKILEVVGKKFDV